MIPSAEQIHSIVSDHLPAFKPTGTLNKLEGGNLNHVWRLLGEDASLIIKYAPPHIAVNPDVPLSSDRIDFEAKALKLFEPSGILHALSSDRIRPPRLLYYDRERSLLIMEDAGDLPGLDSRLNEEAADPGDTGKTLGHFIGKLHKTTCQSTKLRERFNNKDIQQTRKKVQYIQAADYAGEVANTNNTIIRSRTETLGELLLQPGRCLVMGDLWPPSILVKNGNLRIIDWEFAHFGRPMQDVGHFAAHCWMQAHTSNSTIGVRQWKQLWLTFWEEYQQTAGDLFDRKEFNDMTTHIGAEILVRTTGPFKSGYVYQDFPSSHSLVKEAVKRAAQVIISSAFMVLWDSIPSTE